MKNLALLLFFVATSVVAQKKEKIDREQFYNYSPNLEFKIYRVSKARTTSRGNVTYVAKKGKRYASIMFQFKNKSSETQIINFENISLVNKNGTLNKIDFIVKAMKLTSRTNRFEQKIKGNKKRIFAIEFEVPIDKNDKISTLKVNDEIIELAYN